ncbi:MAG: glycosyltransferase family 39 protein [bacterium]
MKRTVWIYLLPALLILMVTLPHLDQGDFRAETAHYGAIGVQAWDNPSLFWSLHEHPSVPYFNKPPLVFWIHGLFLHLFGISLAVARIPAILAAAGCVILTVAIARLMLGRATALATGCVMALSYEFFRRTREISLDMWQLLFILACVWLWMLAVQPHRRRLIWLAGIPLGLALLCKPLIALLAPCILVAWHCTTPGTPTLKFRDLAFFILSALLVALPWHLSMIHLNGEIFTRQYFGHEVVQRLQGLRNREPVWYYAVETGKTYWPWMLLLLAGLLRWRRGQIAPHHRAALRLAALWITAWAVALSLFPDKRPRYALPLYPMLAMIAGYGLATLPWRAMRSWYRGKPGKFAVLIVGTGMIISVLPIQFQEPPDANLSGLTQWIGTQDPSVVFSVALTASDESTLFLKTGHWPKPIRLRHHLSPGCLMIYTDGLAPSPEPGETLVFQQGQYRVTRK